MEFVHLNGLMMHSKTKMHHSNKIRKFYAYDENVQTVSPQPAYQQTTYQQPQTSGGWKAGSF